MPFSTLGFQEAIPPVNNYTFGRRTKKERIITAATILQAHSSIRIDGVHPNQIGQWRKRLPKELAGLFPASIPRNRKIEEIWRRNFTVRSGR